MAFGLVTYAVVFSLLNAAVLAVRIRAENAALRGSEAAPPSPIRN
jgi:methyltransferase